MRRGSRGWYAFSGSRCSLLSSMRFSTILAALGFAAANVAWPRADAQATALRYPSTVRGAQADDVSGTLVADPYRWLENVTAPEVRSWVAAQNALTESWLAATPRRKEGQSLVARAYEY